MAFAPFVPLRIFSAYTMLEGAIEPKDIARRAKDLGFPAAAICDRNGLYGAMAFSESCVAAGVQPIIAALVAVLRPDRPDGEKPVYDWLALYAQDETGYANLCEIVSAAHLDRPLQEQAHVDFDFLARHADGLIALTAGREGALVRLFVEQQDDAAIAYAERLTRIFGDRLYVEICRRLDADEGQAEEALLALAYRMDLPLVATNPACFAESSFHDAHDAMLCIANSTYVERDDRPRSSPDSWIKPVREMRMLFADLPEALANTLVVAQRCGVMAPRRDPILPRMGDKDGEADKLRADAAAGLADRLAAAPVSDQQLYRDRLAFELDVIADMGFSGFILGRFYRKIGATGVEARWEAANPHPPHVVGEDRELVRIADIEAH